MTHSHNILDMDRFFLIDSETRKISVPEGYKKTKLVQYDHNSERFTFEIPRFVENHDMSLSTEICIHYLNISEDRSMTNADVYDVSDIDTFGEEFLHFSWLVSGNATKLNGLLSFAIRFTCFEAGVMVYAWNTEIYSGITIAKGLNNGNIIVEEYSDLLNEWYDKLFGLEDSLESRLREVSAQQQEAIEEKGEKTLATIPEEYAELQEQVDELKSDLTDKIKYLDDGKVNLNIDYAIGTHTADGQINNTVRYCAVTNGKLTITKNSKIKTFDGYVIFVRWYPSGGGSAFKSVGWVSEIDVEAGDIIMITVRKDPENIFDVASTSYGNKIYTQSNISQDIAIVKKEIDTTRERIEQINFDKADKIEVNGINLFNRDDARNIDGYYINATTYEKIEQNTSFISHPIKLKQGKQYYFPNIRLLGSTAKYLYVLNDDGNVIGKLEGTLDETRYRYVATDDVSIVFVGAISSKYLTTFLDGINTNDYIAYMDSETYLDSKIKTYDTENVDNMKIKLESLRYASETRKFEDMLKESTPYTSKNFICLDDLSIDFEPNANLLGYEIINGNRFLVLNVNENGSSSAYHTFDEKKQCYSNFICDVWIEGVENIVAIDIQVGSTANLANRYSNNKDKTLLKNGLNHINVYGYKVGEPNNESIIKIGFSARCNSNGGAIVKFGAVYSYERTGLCTIWIDDGIDSFYNLAFPVMKERGFNGAMSVITSKVGRTEEHFMTLPQLLELKNNGFDLCNHTYYANSLTNLESVDMADFSIRQAKEYLDGLGVGNSANYLVLPQGNINDEIYEIAKRHSTLIRYAGAVHQSVKYCALPYDDWDHVPCYAIQDTTTVTQVKKWIDESVQKGVWIILLFHSFSTDTTKSQIDWLISDFVEICDYLKTYVDNKNIKVVSASEAIALM